MKKLFLFASAVALLASCSKDLTEDLAPAKVTGKSTINATYGSEATRSEATPDGQGGYNLAWELGDAIGVFDAVDNDDTNEYFAFTGTDGEFKGDKGFLVGDGYVAYYPYAENKAIEDGKIKLCIPAEQKYRWNATDKAAGSFAQNVAPAVAYGEATDDDNLTLEFRPVATYMRVPIVGSGKVMQLELTIGDKGLAGEVEVAVEDIIENVAELEPAAAEYTETTITLICGKGEKGVELDMNTPTYFWFVIPGGLTLQNELVTIKVNGGKENGGDELTRQLNYAKPQTTKYNGAITMGQAVENGAAVPFEWIEGGAESYVIKTAAQFIEYAHAATKGQIPGAPAEMFNEDNTLKPAMIVAAEPLNMDINIEDRIPDYENENGEWDAYKKAVFYDWYYKNGKAIETIGGKLAYSIVGNVDGEAAVISNLVVKSAEKGGIFNSTTDAPKGSKVKNIVLDNATVKGGAIFFTNSLSGTLTVEDVVVKGGALETEAKDTGMLTAMYTTALDKLKIDGNVLPENVDFIAQTLYVTHTDNANLTEEYYYKPKFAFKEVVPREAGAGSLITVPGKDEAKLLKAAIKQRPGEKAWFSLVDREEVAAAPETRADEAEETLGKVKTSYWTGMMSIAKTNDQKGYEGARDNGDGVMTAEELAYNAYNGTSKNIELTNNIYLFYEPWVANANNAGKSFDLDGKNYTILCSGLSEYGFAGNKVANIKNVTFEQAFVKYSGKDVEPYLIARKGVAENVTFNNANYTNVDKTATVKDGVIAGLFYEGTIDQLIATKNCKVTATKYGDNKFAAIYAYINVPLGHTYTIEEDLGAMPFVYMNCSMDGEAAHEHKDNTDIRFTKYAVDAFQAEDMVRWTSLDINAGHRVTFFFGTSKDMNNFKEFGGDFTLTENKSVTSLDFAKNATIDLNGNTLTVNNTATTTIKKGEKLVIENGDLVFTQSTEIAQSDICVKGGATLELNNVNITSAAAAIMAQAEGANVTITDSKISSATYCYATNASFENGAYTEGSGATVKFVNSEFISSKETAVICNVPVTITAEKCTFTGGDGQAVYMRVGTATFTDSTFNLDSNYNGNPYRLKQWESGNAATIAALVVGNYDLKEYTGTQKPSYNDPAKVELKGKTTIEVKGSNAANCPAIHVAAANKNRVDFNYVEADVTIKPYTYTLGTNKIEFATTDIYVNGTAAVPNCSK